MELEEGCRGWGRSHPVFSSFRERMSLGARIAGTRKAPKVTATRTMKALQLKQWLEYTSVSPFLSTLGDEAHNEAQQVVTEDDNENHDDKKRGAAATGEPVMPLETALF